MKLLALLIVLVVIVDCSVSSQVDILRNRITDLQNVVNNSIPVQIRQSKLFGRTNVGTLNGFSDIRTWRFRKITGMRMLCGPRVLALQMKYGDEWASNHGFWNPACAKVDRRYTYKFDDTEWITDVEVYASFYVNSVKFSTNKRQLDACGKPQGARKEGTSGKRLEFITGTTACWFDQIRFHWAK